MERSPLESRIAALTAELEQAKAYAAKADEALLDCATAHATERAAREQLCDDYVRMSNDCDLAKGECDILRSERDTALARVKELEAIKPLLDAEALGVMAEANTRLRGKLENQRIEIEQTDAAFEELRAMWNAAESALASARNVLDRFGNSNRDAEAALFCLDKMREALSFTPSPAPCSGCARVRAVVARLSNAAGDVDAGFIVSKLQEALDDAHPIVARSRDQGLRGAIAYHLRDREVGFEDTEPEARAAPVAVDVPWDTENSGRCSEADVCGKKCDHGSECLLLVGHEGGHDTQHGCTFYDAAPVSAPCSGCAKARELLAEWVADLDAESLQVPERLEAWLKEHP